MLGTTSSVKVVVGMAFKSIKNKGIQHLRCVTLVDPLWNIPNYQTEQRYGATYVI